MGWKNKSCTQVEGAGESEAGRKPLDTGSEKKVRVVAVPQEGVQWK